MNREGIAALLPLLDDTADEVGATLEALAAGEASPFARIGSTHFARLVLVRAFPGRDGADVDGLPACLFFGAEFDITVAGYLEALCALLPDEADAVFGSCRGYPGARVPPRFADWMLRHRVRPGFSLTAQPQASVGQVIDALALRERIIRFAVDTQALAPAALRAEWDRADWGRRA